MEAVATLRRYSSGTVAALRYSLGSAAAREVLQVATLQRCAAAREALQPATLQHCVIATEALQLAKLRQRFRYNDRSKKKFFFFFFE
jgi:hypothetical protein